MTILGDGLHVSGRACLAIHDTAFDDELLVVLDEFLAGPSAFVFAGADAVAAAKAVKDFAKDNENLIA